MANKIEVSDKSATNFVTSSSRYAGSDVLVYYGDNKVLTFETYKRQAIDLSNNDKYKIINAGEEYRPDITSYRAYGTPDFWWYILEANNIFDIFDYKAGKNIRVPAAPDLRNSL